MHQETKTRRNKRLLKEFLVTCGIAGIFIVAVIGVLAGY